jgi:caa(3)-type oxidase subunit IV
MTESTHANDEHAPKVHTYLHGKPVENAIECHEHVSPASAYVKVLFALFVLTGLTYAVSFADLGAASLPVAMGVAFAKATLVCMFFMHLKYDDRYHVFVFMSTIIFVAIFFTITIFDMSVRDRLNDEQSTFFRVRHGTPFDDAKEAKNRVEGAPAPAQVPAPTADGDAKARE